MAYNEEPRPRALFIGFGEEHLQSTGLLELFPTTRLLSSVNQLDLLHQGEYDVVFASSTSDLTTLEPHLYVLSFGGNQLGEQQRDSYPGAFYMNRDVSVAKELDIGSAAADDERLQTLIEQTLLPIYSSEASHHTLWSNIRHGRYDQPAKLWHPLLIDRDQNILVGFAYRIEGTKAGSKPELWYLPESISAEGALKWVKYLVDRWASSNPAVFPYSLSWKQSPEWQSTEENRIDTAVATLKAEQAEIEKTFATRLQKLVKEKRTATGTADTSLRALLTTQGDTLKDAVLVVLSNLGFMVIDSDKEIQTENKADKLEDLRVSTTTPDNSDGWVALVEVRGYTKGAKINDLLRLNRFTKRYMQENAGIPPNAIWYIVNHDLRADPKSRTPALQASPGEVMEFGEDTGLIIDTVELFKLKRAVDDSIISSEEARKQLTSSTGYFSAKTSIVKQAK